MTLEDILGRTPEIKVFDFLAQNPEFSYTREEIRNQLNLQKTGFNKIINKLKDNKLIEENESGQLFINDNKLTNLLVNAVMYHSFYIETENTEQIVK